MKWIIYKHTLLVGPHKGWSYIGQTRATDPNKRWKNGKGYLTEDTLFSRAIKKYGIENWDIVRSQEIIESNIQSIEEANRREKY